MFPSYPWGKSLQQWVSQCPGSAWDEAVCGAAIGRDMGAMTCDSLLWLTWFIIWLPGRDLSAALTPLSSTHSPPWPLLYFHLLTLVHWQASLVIALRKIDYQSPFRKEQLFIASPRILRKKKMARGVLPLAVTEPRSQRATLKQGQDRDGMAMKQKLGARWRQQGSRVGSGNH